MEAGAAGRIVNSDETHHKLSNEGERGGSRANTQTDPDLPRTGRRKVANERHITGLHSTTAAGEVLPSFYFFETSCERPEKNLPVWTERAACDTPAAPPVAAAAAAPATAPFPAVPLPSPQAPAPPAPQTTVVDLSAMTAAERRTHMAALTAAMVAHDE